MAAPFASKLFESANNSNDGWDEWDWVENNNASNANKQQQQQQQHHQLPPQQQQQQQYPQQQYQQPQVIQSFNSASIPPLPSNGQQVASDPQQMANFFNPMPVSNSISPQAQSQTEQYANTMPSIPLNNNTAAQFLPAAKSTNNNHLKNANHFQSDVQLQQQQQPQPQPQQQYQQFNDMQSTFVNNNQIGTENNFVQSSTGITNYSTAQNQFSQADQNQNQNQDQWPAAPPPSSFANDNNNASLQQQFMQVESQELLPPPPPIPSRQQYYDPNQQPAEPNLQHENGFSSFTNPQVDNQQSAVPTESSIPSFSGVNNSLPPVLPPPALNQSPFANTNPFKRVGSHSQAHRTPPPIPVVSNANAPITAPVSASIIAPVPESFEAQPVQRMPSHHENVDSIPHNDRNEYLQTGHLSGDGENSNLDGSSGSNTEATGQYSSSDGNGFDSEYPPPGLSRFVLGEPEPLASAELNNQPPPGLDRLIPGTEINHSSNINLERQADGQDTIQPVSNRPNNQFQSVQSQQSINLPPPPPLTSHEIENYEAIPESDRNQYLVAGENPIDNVNVPVSIPPSSTVSVMSHATDIEQRVVTGVENAENQQISSPPERQRELEMDGENLEDQQIQQQQLQQQQQQQHQNRHGSASGGNTNPLSQSESIEELDAPNNKNQSNPSTGNDDSDDKQYYNRNRGSVNRNRNDDRLKKRDEKHENRYETEDTDHSTREKRRSKDRYEEQERNYRGRSADMDADDARSQRDRHGDKSYRKKLRSGREEADRYERYRHGDSRLQRDREDKYSRYETDGSRYDNDDPRYERRPRGEKVRNYGRDRDRDDRVEREDRSHRPKDYDRERDYYRSRNDRYPDYDNDYAENSRRDRKKDRSGNGSERGDGYSSGYFQKQGQKFSYDPYSSYYQQQQLYYENLRRTNPVAYAEWYNRYYANQLSAAASAVANVASDRNRDGRESGRESVHSGRSSSKDNDRAQHQPQSLDYPDQPTEPERLTPFKFTSNHCSASFQNGLLVSAKQKYLPNNEIQNSVNILKFAQNNQTRRLYHMFPGPLSPATHTKQVIDFCLEQIRNGPNGMSLSSRSTSNSLSSLQSMDHANRASFALLWNLLILLLRQRGVFVGSDIAELLLKNRDEFPYDQQQLNSTKLSTAQKNGTEPLSDFDSKDGSNDAITNDSEQLSSSSSSSLSEDEITDKFRNFLLYGSINEALDWATDNNLWGHALFLASKMDRRTHANVMIKFANKLPLVDPLQTLYQLKSGRVPLSVTCTQDEKWGDWRPHLAMIISNPSQTAELDRKSIITMGDTLHNRGDLFAAQFCYLMAKVEFSKYADVKQDASMILNNTSHAVRLILLGASAYKSTFGEFATDEAIIMTEIYEYACALANSQYSIIEFQPYKYLLGTRMLDYGLHLKSLMYMEQVAIHIQKNPTQYDRSFVERVYTLADKLKYFDPVLEKSLDSLNEDDETMQNDATPQWQYDLLNILGQYPASSAFNENTIPMIPVDPYQQQQQPQQQPQQSMSLPPSSQIDQEFTQINQQFQDLSLQYQNPTYEYSTIHQTDYNAPSTQIESNAINQDNEYGQQNQYETHQQTDYYGQTQQTQDLSSGSSNNYGDQSTGSAAAMPPQMYQPQTFNDPMSYGTSNYAETEKSKIIPELSKASNLKSHFDKTSESQSLSQTQSQTQYTNPVPMPVPMSMSMPPPYLMNQSAPPPPIEEDDEEAEEDYDDDDEDDIDGINNVDNVPKPQISMPNSFSNRPGFYDDESTPTANSNNKNVADAKAADNKKSASASADNKKKAAGNVGDGSKGWLGLGGIMNKLSFKPKNQMILPEDKNPTIVWDAENKRWINKDSDEGEAEAFKPPPKMNEMMSMNNSNIPTPMALTPIESPLTNPMNAYNNTTNANAPPPQPQAQSQLQPQLQQQPQVDGASNGPAVIPSLQSNMFKMQRNKTLKNSYVDVFNPSGAAPKNHTPILAPTMPTMPAQQMNFFVPSPNQQQNDEQPTFYNPNQYNNYQQQ